jgi:hypothetical protein
LKIPDLRRIRDKHSSESDALEDVLLLWLNKKYDEKKHGPPTWRMLVEAVNKKTGGDNDELAKQIALNHLAGTILWGRYIAGSYIAIIIIILVNDVIIISCYNKWVFFVQLQPSRLMTTYY